MPTSRGSLARSRWPSRPRPQTGRATEDVKVRGADPDPVQIVETIHGPVVAGDPAHGTALTLKSVQFFDLDRSFDCLLPMLAATSVDSLFQAVRGWGLIDHNLVAADTGGHIGHLVRAVIPRRPAINGWLPVPGWTGEYEWDGVIPAGQVPRVDDPARGFIVTAGRGARGGLGRTAGHPVAAAPCRRADPSADATASRRAAGPEPGRRRGRRRQRDRLGKRMPGRVRHSGRLRRRGPLRLRRRQLGQLHVDRRGRRIRRSGEPALHRPAPSLVPMRAHPHALRLGHDHRRQPAADPPATRQHTGTSRTGMTPALPQCP